MAKPARERTARDAAVDSVEARRAATLQRLQDQATATLAVGDAMAASNPALVRAYEAAARDPNRFAPPAQHVPTGRAPDPMTAEAYRTPAGASPLTGDYLSRGHVDAAQATAAAKRRAAVGAQLSQDQVQALEHIEREPTLWRGMTESGAVVPRPTRSPLMDDVPLPSEQAWLDAQAAQQPDPNESFADAFKRRTPDPRRMI